jgi:hypothetical protein
MPGPSRSDSFVSFPFLRPTALSEWNGTGTSSVFRRADLARALRLVFDTAAVRGSGGMRPLFLSPDSLRSLIPAF